MASRDLAPEIVTLEDDVHHAADRIRAVDRRGTVEQHFHPIDCGDRYREDIDGLKRTVIRHARTIEQRQGRVWPEPTQVEAGSAGDVLIGNRSEESRVGKECVRTCRSRSSLYP